MKRFHLHLPIGVELITLYLLLLSMHSCTQNRNKFILEWLAALIVSISTFIIQADSRNCWCWCTPEFTEPDKANTHRDRKRESANKSFRIDFRLILVKIEKFAFTWPLMVTILVCKYRHCDWNIDWWTPIYWRSLTKFGRQPSWCCFVHWNSIFHVGLLRISRNKSSANQPMNEQNNQPTKNIEQAFKHRMLLSVSFIANQI